MTRPTWDDTWLDVANVVARRSVCVNAQIGAVIVDATNRIVATGYNGPPAGFFDTRAVRDVPPEIGDIGCAAFCPRAVGERDADYHNCAAVHAEANALMFCDRREREGGTIYVTAVPCVSCAKIIANSGAARVVCLDDGAAHRLPQLAVGFIRGSGLVVEVRS